MILWNWPTNVMQIFKLDVDFNSERENGIHIDNPWKVFTQFLGYMYFHWVFLVNILRITGGMDPCCFSEWCFLLFVGILPRLLALSLAYHTSIVTDHCTNAKKLITKLLVMECLQLSPSPGVSGDVSNCLCCGMFSIFVLSLFRFITAFPHVPECS